MTPAGLVSSSLPAWLARISAKVHALVGGSFFHKTPAHVLVNSYQPGQGILPHTDGPSYLPCVAILSLGAAAVFRFESSQPAPAAASTACCRCSYSDATSSTCSDASISSSRPASLPRGSQCTSECNYDTADSDAQSTTPCSRTVRVVSAVLPARSLLVFQGPWYTEYKHGIDATHSDVIDESVLNGAAPYVQALRQEVQRQRQCSRCQRCCMRCCRDFSAQDGCLADADLADKLCCSDSSARCARCGIVTAVGDKEGIVCPGRSTWELPRHSERISMTFRNAAKEVRAFQLRG